MTRRDPNNLNVLKKGEASRLLGFGHTAGYKYLDYLQRHKILLPIRLPGLKTPRYRRDEIEALLTNREAIEGIPAFEPNI